MSGRWLVERAVRRMQWLRFVARKLTMLATLLVLPGGLVALGALLLVVVLARTSRGQVALRLVSRRLPPRLKVPLRRMLVLAAGERPFLGSPRALHTA
jgi:hypothetical protein